MADEDPQGSGWLVEPPVPGAVVVRIAAGEGVELDDAQRAALEELLASFRDSDEVSGFAGCAPQLETCTPKKIVGTCARFEWECATYASCTIANFY